MHAHNHQQFSLSKWSRPKFKCFHFGRDLDIFILGLLFKYLGFVHILVNNNKKKDYQD